MDEYRHIDKMAWRKYLFYVDLIAWGIFAIAVWYTVTNIYFAGMHRAGDQMVLYEESWWRAFTGLAFLVASLAWVFFRFWKHSWRSLQRSF